MPKLITALALILILAGNSAWGREPLSDAQVREAINKESVAAYLATGHPCACPYNVARNGPERICRPGGASPLCYPKDVSDELVAEWRRRHL
jgi:hypothetical protein